MKIEKDYGLSCWGYRPLSAHNSDKGMDFFGGSFEKRREVVEQSKKDIATLKAKGHKPYGDGFKAKIAAIGAASRIEKDTGVEMCIVNHGFI